ncbi:translation initiation factor [Rhodococcus fascians]|nr:translation initiation factor [Rhodococcus fascians]
MPPRGRAVNDSLTSENLTTLAAALAEGRRATVYLREPNPSLGLPDGTSAKVVSIDGNTVTISPKGINDELPYEAEELRITRNAATPPAPAKRVPAKKVSSPAIAGPARTEAAAPQPTTTSAPAKAVAVEQSRAVVDQPRAQPQQQAARRAKKAPGGISVTIHAGADNDWSVTVTQGAKRPTKAQPVSPESVSRAVRELGDPIARDAVEAVISHAREEAARRVAELSRQLEEARTTLAALEQDV